MRRFLSVFPPLVLGLFFLLTLLIEAPLIAFPSYAGDAYQGINIAHFGNDEHHYLSRAKEVLEGNRLGQMYLKDWKDEQDPFFSDIEHIVLLPFAITPLADDINVVTLYNWMNAFGVFVLLLLIYYFALQLSRDKILAAATATFVVGGYVLIENGTILISVLRGGHLFYDNFNIFGRSAFPYMALVPFFLFLIFTYRALQERFQWPLVVSVRPYANILAAGAFLGLLFYTYFYAWTFALALLGSLFLSALLFKRWGVLAPLFAIGAVGTLIGSWKLWTYYAFFTSELGDQISYFFLTEHSRAFISSTTGLAILGLFAIYLYFRRTDANNFILLGFIMAGWISLEQQMLTGRTVQYGHYYWYFVVPFSIIVGTYMLYHLIPDTWKVLRPWLCGLIIAASLVNTIGGQYKSFFTTIPGKMREQHYAPIFARLNSLPQGVVLGDPGPETYPLLMTVYTDHDVYWLPAAITSIMEMDHMKKVFFTYLYLNKEAREDPEGYLRDALSSTTPSVYTQMYEDMEGYFTDIPVRNYWKVPFPHTSDEILSARESFLPAILAEYEEFATAENVRATLKADGIAYVVWDRRQYPEWDLSVLGPLETLETSGDLTLYSLSTN